MRGFCVAGLVVLWLVVRAQAAVYVVEPDDYPDGAALTSVHPQVTLSTLDQNDAVVPLFTVTSTVDSMGFAPTGQQVFAHANVPFWIEARKLRMDFAEPVSSVSLGFAGGTHFDTDFGLLNVYNATGTLLDSYLTSAMGPGQKETMSITRGTNDIAYAIAYSVPGDGPHGPFGRLDALVFDTAIPEPATGMLSLAGLTLIARRRRRR